VYAARQTQGVDHQTQRWFRRKDVLLLRDVFFQNVVLESAGKRLEAGSLLVGHREIHRPQDRGRRINGHRGGYAGERDVVEKYFHVGKRTDGDAAFPHFTVGERMVGVVAHQRGQIEGHR
jgi:hypothetical protein